MDPILFDPLRSFRKFLHLRIAWLESICYIIISAPEVSFGFLKDLSLYASWLFNSIEFEHQERFSSTLLQRWKRRRKKDFLLLFHCSPMGIEVLFFMLTRYSLLWDRSKDSRFFSNMSGKTFNITQEQRNSNYFDDVVESDHDIFRKQRPLLTLRKVGPKHEKEVSKVSSIKNFCWIAKLAKSSVQECLDHNNVLFRLSKLRQLPPTILNEYWVVPVGL